MSDCLDGIVGIWCRDDIVADGPDFYIQDLPGVNLVNAAQVADHENVTGRNLMEKAINFSQRIVVRDFLQRFRASQQLMEQIATDQVGNHGIVFEGLTTTLKGIVFKMRDCTDRYVYGRLDYLEFRTDTAGAVVINFERDGQAPDTINVDAAVGLNRVPMDLNFKDIMRVWVDGALVSLSDPLQTPSGFGCDCYKGSVNRTYGLLNYVWRCCNCIGSRGIESSNVGTPVWEETTHFNGLVASISCKGDPEELVCQYRKELAAALLYRAGAYIMEEISVSSRGNAFVRNSREEAKLLFARWIGGEDPQTGMQYEGEYPRLLEQVVQNAIAMAAHHHSKAFKPTTMIMGDTVKNNIPGPRGRLNSRQSGGVRSGKDFYSRTQY